MAGTLEHTLCGGTRSSKSELHQDPTWISVVVAGITAGSVLVFRIQEDSTSDNPVPFNIPREFRAR